jgi:predicted chitinase/peptidoglycan hydrolase-like protein with peptidoglycan-binding domain
MYPRARADWLDAFGKVGPSLIEFYGIDRLRWVHIAGQIAAETDGLTLNPMRENMSFTSATRIVEIYGYRLGLAIKSKMIVRGRAWSSKAALAQALVGQPTELARVVYSGREGTPAGMGHRYIGRGPLQTTHLNNYRAAGNEIARQPGGGAFDLVAEPDQLATNAELGWRAVFAEWHLKRLNTWADRDDVDTVSDVLNTGNATDNVKPHGLDRRRKETARAKAIWPEEDAVAQTVPPARILSEGAKGEDVRMLQTRLAELGYHHGRIDDKFGRMTKRALVIFQSEHDLKPDGIAGPRTWEVLDTTAPVPIETREDLTATDLKKRGSAVAAMTSRTKKAVRWFFGGNAVYAADKALDLGVVDGAVSQAERAKGLVTRSVELASGIPLPSTWIVVSGSLALLCWLLWRWVDGAEVEAVEDVRSGANNAR